MIVSAAQTVSVSSPLQIMLLLGLLTVLPSLLLVMTGFTRILIVLGFVRNALGTQQIPPNQVRIGMRGCKLCVEARLDGTIAMRFQNEYLRVALCDVPRRIAKPKPAVKAGRTAARKSGWMQGFFDKPDLPLGRAIAIANATG